MMSFRHATFGAALASAALLTASPAAAVDYLYDQTNDSHTLAFDGFTGSNPQVVIPGLTASLMLQLTGGLGTNVLTFGYTLSNTSTVGGAASRVSGFAFNSNPNPTDGTYINGEFTAVNTFNDPGNQNYPNGIGDVEVCLTANNGNACAGGAGSGASLTTPASGSFSLTFAGIQNSVTLGDFFVRYQSLEGLDVGSATGKNVGFVDPRTPLPEPATWAMLMIGFGAVGATLRSRKSNTAERRLRVA